MARALWLALTSVALLIAIGAFIMMGCGCSVLPAAEDKEGFEDKPEPEPEPEADVDAEAKPKETSDDTDKDEAKPKEETSDADKDKPNSIDIPIKKIIAEAAAKKAAAEPAAATKPADKAMTPKEQELFEDLKNNKLSEKEIMSLVKSGILNEVLVEKFLAKLDASAAEIRSEDAQLQETVPLSGDKAASAAKADAAIEGFCSGGYGYAAFK